MSVKTYTGNESVRDSDLTLIIGGLVRRSIRQQAVTVGVTATAIPAIALSKRLFILIINNSDNIVYIGNSSVTTAGGFPLLPRGALRLDIEDDVIVYGVSSAPSEVRILEGG